MIRTFLLPLLAIAGVIFAIVTVIKSSRPAPIALPIVDPAQPPFDTFVAGAGIVEPNTQNIDIGVPLGGLVTALKVDVGQEVKAGDVLFTLDDRDLASIAASRKADIAVAEAEIERLNAQPRLEDLPPARARVDEAVALLDDAEDQLALFQAVTDKRAISEDQLSRRKFAVAATRSRLTQARSTLSLLEAGAWAPDKAVALAKLHSAQASLGEIETEIERRLIRSPVDGVVLQTNIRVGEFAPTGGVNPPMMIVGGVKPLHLRVDVDENDAWRMSAGSRAIAFLRGNPQISATLEFVRFEPLVVPKRSLTGDSSERVDTRVLQLIYRIETSQVPLFVGQLMDVYIESAAPLGAGPQGASSETQQ